MLTDKNSTWENHGDALFKKIASSIGAIKRILIIVCPLLPRVMYIVALCDHTLTFAAWYGVTVLKLCVINCINSRTVRHVFSQTPNYDAHASILLNDLGWQNLETQQQIQKAVMVYKSLNCLAADYMSSKFILSSDLFKSDIELSLRAITRNNCYG